LNQVSANQIKEIERFSKLKSKNDKEMLTKAENASAETSLMRSLVDTLISKVYLYLGKPGLDRLGNGRVWRSGIIQSL